jgi:hypothetical protein
MVGTLALCPPPPMLIREPSSVDNPPHSRAKMRATLPAKRREVKKRLTPIDQLSSVPQAQNLDLNCSSFPVQQA